MDKTISKFLGKVHYDLNMDLATRTDSSVNLSAIKPEFLRNTHAIYPLVLMHCINSQSSLMASAFLISATQWGSIISAIPF